MCARPIDTHRTGGGENRKTGGQVMGIMVKIGIEHMDTDKVTSLLQGTYWARERSGETIRLSMEHSLCFGAFREDGAQVGFARVITDYATSYYLCDVVVDAACRRQGLGAALVSYIERLPCYRGLRGMLITRDAHGLYEKFGYAVLDGRFMVKGLNG